MKIDPGKPVVGATLVVARLQRQRIFIPLYGLHKIPAFAGMADKISTS